VDAYLRLGQLISYPDDQDIHFTGHLLFLSWLQGHQK
jgi:hypothetical protein